MRRHFAQLMCFTFGIVALVAPSVGQTVPEVNECKAESLAKLDDRPIHPGDRVEIQYPSGTISYIARPGESIWELCETTLRAVEAFDEKIASAGSGVSERDERIAALQEDISRLQAQLTQAKTATAMDSAAQPPAPTPASASTSEETARFSSWIPCIIAGLSAILAVVFFIRSASTSRRLLVQPVDRR